ncbi:riboflavin synthase [Thalassorhabdus alkalitolerans]|uniref:Riboflavin synthase n=1 Tax=Thalassorhabdus alkalitolerans TaxID=2282697 RepID=A0ABW0YU61_9BACI
MFTGIIEEKGTIRSLHQSGEAIVMSIEAREILTDVGLGDSIAVNGVCLTVTSFDDSHFTVDVMPETVRATSLRTLKPGSKVNLERAMAAGGRFGGHFVSGHVDGTGEVLAKKPLDNAVYFTIKVPAHLTPYIMNKGSVCIDGISLTVFGIDQQELTLSIIPHTLSETILGEKSAGDPVNIECDMLAKYVDRLVETKLQSPKTGNISESFLEENGFK